MNHPNPFPSYHSMKDAFALTVPGWVYIYALCDPTTKEIRYVGKTERLLERMQQHITRSRDKRNKYHAACWIRSLDEVDTPPLLSILEEIGPEQVDTWEERERYWIKRLRDEGYDLTNIGDGGDGNASYGGLGRKWSPETHAKYSASRKDVIYQWKDLEGTKARRVEGIRGYYARLRTEGIKIVRGPHSEETKAKIGAGNRGKKKPPLTEAQREARREIARKNAHIHKIPIQQLSLEDNLIKVFPSATDAAKDLGMTKTSISNCLNGRAKTAGGFKWAYLNTQPTI